MPAERARDPRLDFFRGLAMLIIFVAHVPGNTWSQCIPARFGFSSAAEMFVFCSGCASAFAFGSVFVRSGWRIGTSRILYRIWQLYWAHIGLFVVLATSSILATRLHVGTRDYVAALSLSVFPRDGLDAILGLATLSYLPDLLNVLPMYIVLLAGVPLAMALSKISPFVVVAASAALWALVQATGLNLPAEGAANRVWFFDPLAWQLIFFTGFAFGMGWLPKPPLNHSVLLPIAAAAVVVSVPINFWAFTNNVQELRSIHDALISDGIVATTQLHILRYTHFLCLSYVVLSLVDRYPNAIAAPAFTPVAAVGRQSLPAFVSGVAAAWLAGMLLDVVGRDSLPVAAVNLLGFAAILGATRCAAWIKSALWSSAEKAAADKSSPSAFSAWVAAFVAGPRTDLTSKPIDG